MTEPDRTAPRDALMPHQWSRRTQAFVLFPLILLLCAWVLFQWEPWTSDDKNGESPAAVPHDICSGMIDPKDVEGIKPLRFGGKIEQQLYGALPESVSCSVGPAEPSRFNLAVNVQPLRGPLDDWPLDSVFWDEQPRRVPFGPGLVGMGSSMSAWLVVPCPGGPHGDLLARADIYYHNSHARPESYVFPQYQHPLAVLLTHTANTMATRSGCQTAPLPEPADTPVPDGPGSVAGVDSSCVSVASDDGPVPRSAKVSSSPARPAPIETCSYEATTRETWFGKLAFVGYRGAMAKYAPPPASVTTHDKVLIARTTGTCGSEPMVWTAWVEPTYRDRGLTAAHDRFVDDAVQRNGCTVEQRFVPSEATAPASSTPVTPTPSRT